MNTKPLPAREAPADDGRSTSAKWWMDPRCLAGDHDFVTSAIGFTDPLNGLGDTSVDACTRCKVRRY